MLGGEQPLQAPPSVQPLTFWTYKDTQRCFSDHGHNISVEGLPCVLLHFRKGRRRQRRAHRSLFELRAKVIKVFSSSCSHHASIPLNLLQGIYLKGKKKTTRGPRGTTQNKKKTQPRPKPPHITRCLSMDKSVSQMLTRQTRNFPVNCLAGCQNRRH